VIVWHFKRFLLISATLFTTVATAGCGVFVQTSSARTSDISSALPTTGSPSATAVHRTVHASRTVSLPPMVKNLTLTDLPLTTHTVSTATVIKHGEFMVDGHYYLAPPGKEIAYVAMAHALVWTVIPSSAHGATGKQVFYTSPYSVINGTLQQPVVLRPLSIYNQIAIPTGAQVQLFNWTAALLFSITWKSNGSPITQYQTLGQTGQAHTLLTVQPTATVRLSSLGDILLYASAHSDSQVTDSLLKAGYYNATTGIRAVVPATSWPLSVIAISTDSTELLSGGIVYSISPHGQITASHAPIAPQIVAQVQTLPIAKWPMLYMPSQSWTSANGQPMQAILIVNSPAEYQIELLTKDPTPKLVSHLIIRRTTAQTPIASRVSDESVQAAIPSFFGNYAILHTFTLTSQAGVTVRWMQAVQPKTSKPAVWFTSFSVAGWRYVSGPFGSPADHSQTTALSGILYQFSHFPPLPSVPKGQLYMKMSADDQAVTTSQVRFAPTATLSVTGFGPGLNPLQVLSTWTVHGP